jgi:hypothetical protein
MGNISTTTFLGKQQQQSCKKLSEQFWLVADAALLRAV